MGTACALQLSYSLQGQPHLVLQILPRRLHRPFENLVHCSRPKPSVRNLQLFEELVREKDNSPHVYDPIAPRTDAYKPEDGELITPGVPAWLHDLFTEGVGGIGCIADDLVGVSTLVGP